MPRLPRYLALSCLSLLLAQAVAAAEDWSPELLPADGPYRAPDAPIVLHIPPHVPVEVLQRLVLEIDAIDMTRFVQRQDALAIVSLPEPLAPGERELRIVEYGADGSIIERGRWLIDIRRSAALRDYGGEVAVAGSGAQRLADGQLQTAAERFAMQAGGDAKARLADGHWETTGHMNAVFDNVAERTATDRHADIGEYTLAASYAPGPVTGALQAGHQQIGENSLLIREFRRRGLSARLGSTATGAQMTGFALRTDPVVGVNDFFGVARSRQRVHGAVAETPLPGLSEHIALSAAFFSGEGGAPGFAVGGTEERMSGHGWSLASDSLWFAQRLRLRGEFAASRITFDDEVASAPERDHAYAFLAQYAPAQPALIAGRPLHWQLTAQHERVGTFFASLANPLLIPDRRTTSLASESHWGTWQGSAQIIHQTDNVEKLAALPRHRILDGMVGLHFTPGVAIDATGRLPWYGQPTAGIFARYADVSMRDAPEDFAGTDSDNRSREVGTSFGSAYHRWQWTLAHSLALLDDDSGLTGDRRSNLTDLNLHFMHGTRLSLSAHGQWDHLVNRSTGLSQDTYQLGFGAGLSWLQDRLYSSLSYSIGRVPDEEDSLSTTHFVGGEQLWNLPVALRGGLRCALSLSASYQSALTPEQRDLYQVFVGLKISSQLRYD